MNADIIIIGGGMSGLVAAIVAARGGAKTLIIEYKERVGQKILATGNGRCNLGNVAAEPWLRYNDPEFVKPVLSEYGVSREFWPSVGVRLREIEGRLYPHSLQAGTVLNALMTAAKAAGVVTVTGKAVTANDVLQGYSVFSNRSPKLILATGSKATTGSEAYDIAQKFGHHVSTVYPILGPLITDKRSLKGLKGVRMPATVRAVSGGKTIGESAGEVIFKDNGISGTAIFDLSVILGRKGYPKCDLYIDFAPDIDEKELSAELKKLPVESFVHKEIARNITDMGGNAAKLLKAYPVYDVRPGSMQLAQVATGGLKTEEFSPLTLESKLSPGFFAAGEVLNIDGECGGFNLMWAAASGQAAAKGALGER